MVTLTVTRPYQSWNWNVVGIVLKWSFDGIHSTFAKAIAGNILSRILCIFSIFISSLQEFVASCFSAICWCCRRRHCHRHDRQHHYHLFRGFLSVRLLPGWSDCRLVGRSVFTVVRLLLFVESIWKLLWFCFSLCPFSNLWSEISRNVSGSRPSTGGLARQTMIIAVNRSHPRDGDGVLFVVSCFVRC